MAKVHWEITAEDKTRVKNASGIASREVLSHISTWTVAIDSYIFDNDTGCVTISDHKDGTILGQISFGRNEKGKLKLSIEKKTRKTKTL